MSEKQALLAEKLKKLSPSQREALLAKLQAKKSANNIIQSVKDRPISRVERRDDGLYPLSFSQQRLWFLTQLEGVSSAYNIAGGFSLQGDLDIGCLEKSIQQLITNNEILRTRFVESVDGPSQKVEPALQWTLACEEISEDDIASVLSVAANTHFDLTQSPLFSIQLFKISKSHHVLSLVLHHIISDGWSNQIMMSQISSYYAEFQSSENKEPAAGHHSKDIQYVDFTAYHHQVVEELGDVQVKFWEEALVGNEPLVLTPDFNRDKPADSVEQCHFNINADTRQLLESACRKNSVTPFSTLLAIFQLVLSRSSNQCNFAVGIPSAGRIHENIHQTLGFFVNSLAIPCQINDSDSSLKFLDLTKNVNRFIVEAQSNQDIPFEKIVEHIQVDRHLDSTPIFQTFFSYDVDDISVNLQLGSVKVDAIEVNLSNKKFDTALTLKNTDNGINAILEYDASLYSAERMTRISQYFTTLIDVFIADASANVFTANMLSDDEQQWQKYRFNSLEKTELPYSSIQQGFVSSAAKHSQCLAVSDGDKQLTYKVLDEKTNQLGSYLLEKVPASASGEQAIYAVCLERGINMSIALLATLKAGAAYLPCLNDMPEQRLRYVLNDAEACVVICDNKTEGLLSAICAEENILLINIDASTYQQYASTDLIADVDNTDKLLFNLIYTSGSTGKPKGVMVPQLGIVNRLAWMQSKYPIAPTDKILQKTPFNFDVSVWELFWPLLQGASVQFLPAEKHKEPEAIAKAIQALGITVCHFVPSMLEVFLQVENVGRCTSLKQVLTSGEALLQTQVNQFFSSFSSSALANLYGPTEASIDVTWHDCIADETSFNNMVSIGRPIDNTQLYVLDKHKQLMPKGSTGDLYIAGVGLATAYKNLPEQTKASFIAHELAATSLLYFTGDLARINERGELDYQGRSDQQVKIRGLRIELGEIEQALISLPDILQVALSVVSVAGADQLIAYVVSDKTPNKTEINAQLKNSLPDYMLPFDLVQIEALPLSANGKLNRKLLPAYQAEKKVFIAARNDLDEQLIVICKNLLSIDSISIEDNFFELGGHSLLATRLLMNIKQTFEIDIPLKSVFEMNTLAELSDFISVLIPSHEIDESDDDDFEEGVL